MFFELLDKYGFDNLTQVLKSYSEIRVPDAHAICDLAAMNYVEVSFLNIKTKKKKKRFILAQLLFKMRYLVTTTKYKLRKVLDNFLNKIFPKSWIPLYTMVTFSRIRYSEVVEKRSKQDKVKDENI